MIAVFGAFNAIVSHYELVQSLAARVPRARTRRRRSALRSCPSTITAIHDVREADRARTGGRAVRRGRLLRQIVPVLENGLERAVDSGRVDGLARASRDGGAAPSGAGAGWCGGARSARARRRVRRLDRSRVARSRVVLVVGGGVAMVVGDRARVHARRRACATARAGSPAPTVAVMAGVFAAPALLVALSDRRRRQPHLVRQPAALAELHVLPALSLARRCSRRSSARPKVLFGRSSAP